MIPLATGVTTTREMAFNLETWSEGGLRYVVVGDATPPIFTNSASCCGLPDIHNLSSVLRYWFSATRNAKCAWRIPQIPVSRLSVVSLSVASGSPKTPGMHLGKHAKQD